MAETKSGHTVPTYSLKKVEAEGRIELEHFTSEDAFELGTITGDVIREWGVSLAVDIVIGSYLVYRARLGSTGPGNDSWLAGKAAVARHFGESSLLVKLRQKATGVPFEDLELDHDVMKAHGGSLPIYVVGALVGTITTSGERDVVDHEVATEAVRRFRATLS